MRRKTAAIAEDLGTLDADQPDLATAQFLPQIVNQEQALGAMYLIEGSTLGGQMIKTAKGLSFLKVTETIPWPCGRGSRPSLISPGTCPAPR